MKPLLYRKAERSMSCKGIFDKLSAFIVQKKVETHNFKFYLNKGKAEKKSTGKAANGFFWPMIE